VVTGLQARLAVVRPGFDLRLDLDVHAGEVVALVGPNGAGKSTALRALAGLLALHEGRVELDGRLLADTSQRLHLPAHERGVGVVFQDHLLFPHLSVLDNVAFGLTARGRPRAQARAAAAAWLARMELAPFAGARPRTLSGGQAQRVALARALATDPGLLLLDEPMAALDARTRLLVRGELRRHLQAFDGATVVVTHDPVDAAVLADRLVVVEDGRVVQSGTPVDVATRPRTDYVARLVGLNLLAGEGDGTSVRLPGGGVVQVAERVRGPVRAAFRPATVSLFTRRPEGSPRNVWPGRVAGLEPHGSGVRIEVVGAPGGESSILAEVTAAAVAELDLRPGSPVWATVKASDVAVYPDGPEPAP
jgi:molybdate transport system ATP-binding protein